MTSPRQLRLSKDEERRLRELQDTAVPTFAEMVGILNLSPARDFRRANLSGMNLRDVDFSGFDLFGADLSDTDLTGATFADAEIEGILLTGALVDRTRWPKGFKLPAELRRAANSRRILFSATLRNFGSFRAQLRRACNRRGFMARESITRWNTTGVDAAAAARDLVEEASLYVCIYGRQCGYTDIVPGFPGSISAKDFHIPITEIEFDHAMAIGKPCVVFHMREDEPPGPALSDYFSRNNALWFALQSKLLASGVVREFRSYDDLEQQLMEVLDVL